MNTINEEYKIISKNSADERLDNLSTITLVMDTIDGSINTRVLSQESYYKPLEFIFNYFDEWEKKYGKITKLDVDFIYNGVYGLIFSNKHKDYFTANIMQDDVIFHKVVIIGEREDEEDELFEGFWLMLTPSRPLQWVDIENSWYFDIEKEKTIFGAKNHNDIYALRTLQLDVKVKTVPLENRQIFNIEDDKNTYFMNAVIHNDLVDYLQKNDKKEQLRFFTIQEVQENGFVPSD